MIERAFALCGIGQAIGAEIFAAEVRFAVFRSWVIGLKDEFVILQSGCEQKAIVQNTKDETVEAVGYSG